METKRIGSGKRAKQQSIRQTERAARQEGHAHRIVEKKVAKEKKKAERPHRPKKKKGDHWQTLTKVCQ